MLPAGTAYLGRSVLVKGELTGSQDLTVDGSVEGLIELPDHELTVGPNASVQAQIVARTVTIFGSVAGSITVSGTLHIRHGGSLEGDVVCAHLAIQDRAHFCGSVKMDRPAQRISGAQPDGQASRPAAVA